MTPEEKETAIEIEKGVNLLIAAATLISENHGICLLCLAKAFSKSAFIAEKAGQLHHASGGQTWH